MVKSASVLCFVLLACAQTQVKNGEINASLLYGHWIHSAEEDDAAQRTMVFRPQTYSFPPSRGRDGFELKENSELVSHPIAPSEGSATMAGHWKLDDDQLSFTVKSETFKYKIVSVTKEKLVLRLPPTK